LWGGDEQREWGGGGNGSGEEVGEGRRVNGVVNLVKNGAHRGQRFGTTKRWSHGVLRVKSEKEEHRIDMWKVKSLEAKYSKSIKKGERMGIRETIKRRKWVGPTRSIVGERGLIGELETAGRGGWGE